MSLREETRPPETRRGPTWAFGVVPLLLVALVIGAFLWLDPLKGLRESFPPVEELSFQRVTLNTEPREIVVRVTNGGPDPVAVAQVLVDDAYWNYSITPSNEIGRLGSATIRIPYPWVDEEAHHLVVLSQTGVAFEHEIEVAVATPSVGGRTLLTFTLLGTYVGVIPVFLGLAFLPFIRRLDRRWVHFFLALTAGLLVFLGVEALDDALEVAGDVPGAFSGVGLVTLGVLLAVSALFALDAALRRRRGEIGPYFIAGLIALGIGLHNLGEGLAIGAAYALGEVGLTAFLVLGFTLHNVTEGIGIASPLARERPSLVQLAGLGLLAGVPTIFGTWIGGLSYSPTAAVLFLALGAGAIAQVVWEVGRLIVRETKTLAEPLVAAGFATGVLVMYLTGLVVAA